MLDKNFIRIKFILKLHKQKTVTILPPQISFYLMNNMKAHTRNNIGTGLMRNITLLDDDIRVEKNAQGIETFVFDPYNPLNKLISKDEIQAILGTYGIQTPVYNYELYRRAFIHRSHLKRPELENNQNGVVIVPKPEDCLPLNTKSNERLEFVGDGVLECITKFILYRRFPKENEGFMTEKKIALVKNEAIGRIAHEMGLHKWVVLSKHAELKQTRTNLKKLGCLFEAFLGALFLDFNKINVKDEHGWFDNTFLTGPGFQMAQVFVENVFEKHVDWIELIRNDDNYKNILQVRIQKEFKVTPDYMEYAAHEMEEGYHMGVYLCLGQPIHAVSASQAMPMSGFGDFAAVHQYMSEHGRCLILLGKGAHKIKKKAEQIACEEALR
jgi:dsRNA-specific ribonuclease